MCMYVYVYTCVHIHIYVCVYMYRFDIQMRFCIFHCFYLGSQFRKRLDGERLPSFKTGHVVGAPAAEFRYW